jgi:hypothetical protein
VGSEFDDTDDTEDAGDAEAPRHVSDVNGHADEAPDYEGPGAPGAPGAPEEVAHSALPPKVESWRQRSATGAILTGIALGLQQVFEKEREQPGIVMETSGEPPTDLPVEAEVEQGRPRKSVVNIRPWLLGKRDGGHTEGGAAGDRENGGPGVERGSEPGVDRGSEPGVERGSGLGGEPSSEPGSETTRGAD